MDGIQLTFYEITPAPTPTPKVKINKIPAGPVSKSKTCAITMIRELPTSEQPVHRLEHFGAGALSTVELLAIILGSDNFEDPAALLAANERLFGLAQLPWEQLVAVKGIGPTRAAARQGRLRDRPPAASRHAGGESQDQIARRRCQPPDDGHDDPGTGTPQGRHPGHAKSRPEDPHRLHRLAEHRRRPRRRTLPRGDPPQRCRHHRTVTTIPAAILARPPKMCMSPGKSWRPAS